ncbi:MAG: PEP-CTERM sorting domain-containing protein, partial [Planctomycetota bacterium]
NRDHRDHMVTYAIYEQDHLTGFALFFEDLHKHHSDKDFNDAAVLLSLVPTPQAAGLALAGLGGVGLTAARRRRNS